MADPIDITSQIETAAGTASSVSVDGQTVNERSLTELIEAQKFFDKKKPRPLFGRTIKINRPGPVG